MAANLFSLSEFMRLKQFLSLGVVCFLFFLSDLYSQDLRPDWVTGQHETLPEWVYSLPEKGTVIASSDPCMTLEDGRKQAVQRAFWLFTLQNRVQIRMLSDVFSTAESSVRDIESHAHKILSFIMMNNRIENYLYEIANEYQTLFGEVILQVRFITAEGKSLCNHKVISFSSQSEWMVLYTDDRYTKKEYKIVIRTQSDKELADSFEIKGSWDHPVINSFFEGKRVFIPQKGCWYKESFGGTSFVVGQSLEYSFWIAYIAGLAEQMFSYSFFKSNIQSVLDNYRGNIVYDLSREKAMGDFSIISQIQGIKQNRLVVDWKIYPIPTSDQE